MYNWLVDTRSTPLTKMVQAVAMLARQCCCSPAEAVVDYGDVRELQNIYNDNFKINLDFLIRIWRICPV